jgi:four helix bundle protein
MSRDHERLRVFREAHQLTLLIYEHTRGFPREEWFGVRAQIRRAAISIPCNIVEGNARQTARDYLRFLHIALGSAAELKYLVSLTADLGLATPDWRTVGVQCDSVLRQLQGLISRMDRIAASDKRSGPDR